MRRPRPRLLTPRHVQGGAGNQEASPTPSHKGLGDVGALELGRSTAVLLLWVPEPSTREDFGARVPTHLPSRVLRPETPPGLTCSFNEHSQSLFVVAGARPAAVDVQGAGEGGRRGGDAVSAQSRRSSRPQTGA